MKKLLYSSVIVSLVLLALLKVSQLSSAQNESEANPENGSQTALQETNLTQAQSSEAIWTRIGVSSVGQGSPSDLAIAALFPPTVNTETASNITTTGFRMNGSVNPNAVSTQAFFEWSLSSTLSTFNTTGATSINGTSTIALSSALSGGTCGTTYYFRMAATPTGGSTVRGSIVSVTTLACASTLSITTTAFNPPTATVGAGYSANAAVAATGGQTPYSWSATGFPNGMSINSSSGAPFGTPTVAGTFNVTVTVRDNSNPQQTASKVLSISVNPASNPLSITSTAFNPPTATVGVGYSANGPVAATGGVTPYSWSATGFPNGMSINSSSGAPFGTPTVSGTFNVTITVRDNSNPQQTAQKTLPLTVNPATSSLSITTTSLPGGTVGIGYGQGVTATGGVTPYTWSTGGLAPGLQINETVGAIFGTPTLPGTFPFTVTVRDSGSPQQIASKSLSITIAPATSTLLITSTAFNPPTATVGVAYGAQAAIASTGGVTPYSWSATGFPNGMSINSSSGAPFGTPTVSGTFNVTVTVRDSSSPQQTASRVLTLTVNPASNQLSIANTAFNPTTATVGVGYAANSAVTSTGGQTPYTWSATGFPNGMSINSTSGAPFGTPTVAGTFNVTVTVRDSSSPQLTASKVLPITVVGSGTPPVPVLNSPAEGASYPAGTTAVNLIWGAVTGATTFNLQVGTSCGGTSIANWNQGATSSLVSGLSNATTYFWRVQSVGTGGASAYSNCRSFTVNTVAGSPPPVPPLNTPAEGTSYPAGTTSVNLVWGAVTGASTYYLQVGTSCGGTSIADWSISSASVAVLPLNNGTSYYWRVRSIGSGGTSAYSTCRSFSVNTATPNSVQVRPLFQTCRPNCSDPNNIAPWGPDHFGPISCTNCTFNNTGCVVSVLAMALNYVLEKDFGTNGQNFTPLTLHNTLPLSGFTSGGSLDISTINNVLYQTANGPKPFEWFDIRNPTNTTEGLSAVLANGYPVYVRVLWNQTYQRYDHGVIVTGKEGTRFKIIDPGHPYNNQHFYLDEYDHPDHPFLIRGYVKSRYGSNFSGLKQSIADNSNENASLSVSSGENIHLMLIDPLGRRTGFNPATQQVVNEIPNSSYDNELNLDPFTLDPLNSAPPVRMVKVTNPLPGNYQVVSYGVTTGAFELDVKSISRTGQLKQNLISGNIQAGATVNSSFDFNSTNTISDFDGDSKTDLSIFRPNAPNGAEWWWNKSSDGGNGAVQFGASTDKIVAADYTGDGKTDVAFWRPSTGQWFVLRSEDFSFYAFPFGATGDVPVPGDYDGDGKADAAVFRESSLTWFISKSSGGTDIVGFGAAGDKPVNADYDGDGKADIAIYRSNGASGSEWWIRRSSNLGVFATQFGQPTDKAVQGDYTGDGKADIAFWTPSSGNWFVLRSEDFSYYAFPFGASTDVPVPGDYDGDGKMDAAVFRASSATWFANRSTAGVLIQQFGIAGDVPVPGAFVR